MDTEDILGLGSAVETIAQLGRDATALDVMTIIPPADAKGLVPFTAGFERRDGEMKSFAALAEEWRIHPARKRGTSNVSTLASFIELVRRHQTDHSAIFASTSWPKLGLLAVIDYHEAAAGNPAFCQHKINYTFPVTEEFKAWLDTDGKAMTQAIFAAFIEDRIAEIAGTSREEEAEFGQLFQTAFATPADMMMLSRGLEVHVSSAVKAAHTLSSGEKEIVFHEEHDTKITVPGLFMVSVPAFLDANPVRLPARLRYRVANGSLSWFYQLYRWKELLRAAIVKDVASVTQRNRTCPPIEGTPEQGS
jgi:uncharacterized protein YfdQ (DUF2303 family)